MVFFYEGTLARMATEPSVSGASCLILSNDFFFGSRLCEAVKSHGHQVTMAATLEASVVPTADWQLVVLDLTLQTVTIEEVVAWREKLASTPKLLAFGPHVRTGQLERAREGGCDLVLTRGQLDQQFQLILGEHLSSVEPES